MSSFELGYNNVQGLADLLVGQRIVDLRNNDTLILDNGVELRIETNDGCWGCASGNYELKSIDMFDSIITRVKLEDDDSRQGKYDEDPHTYTVFVYSGKKSKKHSVLAVSGDDGNGYYGTGYSIHVTVPEQ